MSRQLSSRYVLEKCERSEDCIFVLRLEKSQDGIVQDFLKFPRLTDYFIECGSGGHWVDELPGFRLE